MPQGMFPPYKYPVTDDPQVAFGPSCRFRRSATN